jgi:hypothetical protein
MKIQITENKSQDTIRPNNVVRVFVDWDYTYGYWIDEQLLFSMFTDAEQAQYLNGDGKMDVSPVVAQAIIDHGTTPYSKLTVWKA